MLTRIDPIKVGRQISLHVIKSDKFKTNLIGVYIQRPLSHEEATKNALLSMLLPRATKTYPTSTEVNKKLEELYGTILISDVVKKGERQILELKMQLPNEKYVNNENVFEEGLIILNEILNNPYIENEEFSPDYFQQEKDNLSEKIKGRINDKMKYAVDRCVEEMCEEESFSVYEYGSINELEKLENKTLYKHYSNILSSSPIDIFVVGDVEESSIEKLISERLKLNSKDTIKIKREQIEKNIENIKCIEDNFKINQGKLTLGYRTNIPYESELYESSVIFSNILGGGPNSKLFKNIREKESLCYYIFSKIEKFKSIMLISSGIEFQSFEKTRDLVNIEIDSLKNGNFDENDIEIAKKSIVTSIKSLTDAPNMLMDFYYAQVLSNVTDDIDKIMEKINKVDKDSIIEAGNKFQLDTIYFLNSSKEGN